MPSRVGLLRSNANLAQFEAKAETMPEDEPHKVFVIIILSVLTVCNCQVLLINGNTVAPNFYRHEGHLGPGWNIYFKQIKYSFVKPGNWHNNQREVWF